MTHFEIGYSRLIVSFRYNDFFLPNLLKVILVELEQSLYSDYAVFCQ